MGIDNPVHLLFIGVIALLVLGPKRLPELARAVGKGVREFREAINTDASSEPEQPVLTPPREPQQGDPPRG
jgi:sec-independent protein translocase protein TatA